MAIVFNLLFWNEKNTFSPFLWAKNEALPVSMSKMQRDGAFFMPSPPPLLRKGGGLRLPLPPKLVKESFIVTYKSIVAINRTPLQNLKFRICVFTELTSHKEYFLKKIVYVRVILYSNKEAK